MRKLDNPLTKEALQANIKSKMLRKIKQSYMAAKEKTLEKEI